MTPIEVLRVVVVAASSAGIVICVGFAYKNPTLWGYAVPPGLWLLNVFGFCMLRTVAGHTISPELALQFNLWGQSVLLQGALTILFIGGYYLWKPR